MKGWGGGGSIQMGWGRCVGGGDGRGGERCGRKMVWWISAGLRVPRGCMHSTPARGQCVKAWRRV